MPQYGTLRTAGRSRSENDVARILGLDRRLTGSCQLRGDRSGPIEFASINQRQGLLPDGGELRPVISQLT